MANKICTSCNDTKQVSQFYPKATGTHGVEAWCKECRRTHRKQYYIDNLGAEQARAKRYNAKNRDKRRQARDDAALLAQAQARAAELFRERHPDEWAQIVNNIQTEQLLC